MLKNISKYKLNLVLFAVLIYSLGYILNPIYPLIVLILLFAYFIPLKGFGVIARLLFSIFIYLSLISVSGIILYLVDIKFTKIIDLSIQLILVIPSIIYSKKIENSLNNIFPIKEIILLGLVAFSFISMGTFLVSQNSLQQRIEQLARGSDSISHYAVTNEIFDLKNYVITKSDTNKIKYNFVLPNPYPEAVHYVIAQFFLFLDNSNLNKFQTIKENISIFLWTNLFFFSCLIPLALLLINKFMKSYSWREYLIIISVLAFIYYRYYQTLLMFGFFPNIFGLCIASIIAYLICNLNSARKSNSNLVYLGILVLALSLTYTLYLPPVLISIYYMYYRDRKVLERFNIIYKYFFFTFLFASICVLLFITLGEGVSSINIPGSIILIPLVVILPALAISFLGFVKNKKIESIRCLFILSSFTAIWSFGIGIYQLITSKNGIGYYYYKNLYLLIIFILPLFILGLIEIFKFIKRQNNLLLKLAHYLLVIVLISIFYNSIENNGNRYFDTQTYYFPNTSNGISNSSTMITGLNISNKSAYDIVNWIRSGSIANLVFVENCGTNDTFMSNRMAFALSLKGNWAMSSLSSDSDIIKYTKSFSLNNQIKIENKNNPAIKYINGQLKKGRPVLMYIGDQSTYLFNFKPTLKQKYLITDYYTCPNF